MSWTFGSSTAARIPTGCPTSWMSSRGVCLLLARRASSFGLLSWRETLIDIRLFPFQWRRCWSTFSQSAQTTSSCPTEKTPERLNVSGRDCSLARRHLLRARLWKKRPFIGSVSSSLRKFPPLHSTVKCTTFLHVLTIVALFDSFSINAVSLPLAWAAGILNFISHFWRLIQPDEPVNSWTSSTSM